MNKPMRVMSPNAPRFELDGQCAAIHMYNTVMKNLSRDEIIDSAEKLFIYFTKKEFKGTQYGGAFADGFRRMAYIIAQTRGQ